MAKSLSKRKKSVFDAGLNVASWLVLIATAAALFLAGARLWIFILLAGLIGVLTVFDILLPRRPPRSARSNEDSGRSLATRFAPLALAIAALWRFDLVDWQIPLLIAAALGLPVAAIQTFQLRPEVKFGGRPISSPIGRRVLMAILIPFFCYMGPGSLVWSSVVFVNAMIKPELANTFRSPVLKKYEDRGRYGPTYSVTFRSMPALNGITFFRLGSRTYARLNVGRDACVEVWRGGLSIRWYQVTTCRPLM